MKKHLLFFLALFLLAPIANAAITFDASSTSATQAGTTGSGSITMGSGSNGIVLICLAMNSGVTSTLAIGAGTGTQIAHKVQGAKASDLYYFLTSSAGVVNATATTGGSTNKVLGMETFFGVNQSTPIEASTTFGATTQFPSSSITTVTVGDFVVDCLASAATSTSPNAGQTASTQNAAANPFIGMSYKSVPVAGVTTTGWTLGASAVAAYANVAIVPAAGATTTTAAVMTWELLTDD